ncbi:MAG: molybdopterin containing oxidoreductase, partial [Gammaproteobacteria bacterium]|nr:molybdopterin containing oxidoreductase [Gammaproteobacteria bacterium]
MRRKERGIHNFFANDPEAADWQAWGRRSSSITRRGFVTGLSTLSTLVGARIVFAN